MGYDVQHSGMPAWTAIAATDLPAFVLASESLAEAFRRAGAALATSTAPDSVDEVIDALGCDLAADGWIDGGGRNASPRVAATFRAALASVLTERIADQLRVDGQDAAPRLDAAIVQVAPAVGAVASVAANPILVGQAREQLAILVDQLPGSNWAQLLALLDQTSLADLSTVVAQYLNGLDVATLDATTTAVAQADDGVVAALLEAARAVRSAAMPIVSLAVSPADIPAGQSANLSWASKGATQCWASEGWQGNQPLQGAMTTPPVTTPVRYTLTCSGLGGTASEQVELAVDAALPPRPPSVDLQADPATVAAGGSVTLSWTSDGATQCTAGGAWSGDTATSGNTVVGPINQAGTYSLSCTGAGGTSSDAVNVAVGTTPTATAMPAAVTASLQASPAWVAPGESSLVTWSSSGATACNASGNWSGAKTVSGSVQLGPLNADSAFTISCTGPGGTAVASTSVSMRVARLSWQPSDSSTAQETSGFRIYHGTAPGQYDAPTVLPASASEFELALAPGTHYFTLAAVRSDGSEGPRSNEVSKTVQ
jgi:hypothetical protein